MKIIKTIFDFTGLNTGFKILKAIGILVVLFFAFKVLMLIWAYVASFEPSTRKKIGNLSNTIILTKDSLVIAQKQVLSLSDELYQKDSVIQSQQGDLDIAKSNEKKFQSLILELSRQNKVFKDNGAYFIFEKALFKKNNKLRLSTKAEVDSLLR